MKRLRLNLKTNYNWYIWKMSARIIYNFVLALFVCVIIVILFGLKYIKRKMFGFFIDFYKLLNI